VASLCSFRQTRPPCRCAGMSPASSASASRPNSLLIRLAAQHQRPSRLDSPRLGLASPKDLSAIRCPGGVSTTCARQLDSAAWRGLGAVISRDRAGGEPVGGGRERAEFQVGRVGQVAGPPQNSTERRKPGRILIASAISEDSASTSSIRTCRVPELGHSVGAAVAGRSFVLIYKPWRIGATPDPVADRRRDRRIRARGT
jgi:hypothetical protein